MSDDDTPDQIPLLQDIVYERLPLTPPPRRRGGATTSDAAARGPDYDPDTLDLFAQCTNEHADAMAGDPADEVRCLTDRLRDELTHELNALLDDLTADDAGTH